MIRFVCVKDTLKHEDSTVTEKRSACAVLQDAVRMF